MALMLKLAVAGAGISFGIENSLSSAIMRGERVPVLEDFCLCLVPPAELPPFWRSCNPILEFDISGGEVMRPLVHTSFV